MREEASHFASIGRREFEDFRRLIREVSGIALGDGKDALLTARVARRMRALGITDHGEYYETVTGDMTGLEMCQLIDAVSTNVTSFFREAEHFVVLERRLREIARRGGQVRMWSAACATGEEPYSMAMVAADALEGTGANARILATDISGAALLHARRGIYERKRIDNVPPMYRSRFLSWTTQGFEVAQSLRGAVTFARINLSNPPFPMAGPFEAIMCRNVMIYFAPETRSVLLAEMERLLVPGGLLFLGHAESLAGLDTALRPVAPAVYARAGDRA